MSLYCFGIDVGGTTVRRNIGGKMGNSYKNRKQRF